MITRQTASKIRRVIREDFDLGVRRVYLSPSFPRQAFAELVDGAIVTVEIGGDWLTDLFDELPADAVIC